MVFAAFAWCAAGAWGDTVHLKDGDTLEGTVLGKRAGHLILVHPDLGRMSIDETKIESVDYTDKAGEAIEAAPESPWVLSFSMGGSLTNNDEGVKSSLNMRGQADRLEQYNELRSSFAYLYKVDNGEVDENQFTALANQTWLSPDTPWMTFVRPRFDYDEFRSWTERAQLHAGKGLRVVNEKTLRLSLQAGAGVRKDWGSTDDATVLEGLVGFDLRWDGAGVGKRVSQRLGQGRQSANLSVDYYPTIAGTNRDPFDDHRAVTTASWRYVLSREHNLSLVTNLEWEYTTDPDPGFPRNVLTWTWGLQWDW